MSATTTQGVAQMDAAAGRKNEFLRLHGADSRIMHSDAAMVAVCIHCDKLGSDDRFQLIRAFRLPAT